jgi:hypothetical protein
MFRAVPVGPRRSIMRLGVMLLIAPVILASCSRNPTSTGTHTLSGRVRLVATLRNDLGDSTGIQRIENVDSVRVYLYQGATLKDSTRSAAGGYQFAGLTSGAYPVTIRLWGDIGDSVSIASLTQDASADTLALGATSAITASPNPFSSQTRIDFPILTAETARMIVQRPSGLTVRTLFDRTFMVGNHSVLWDGTDDVASPLPSGAYWILFASGADDRAVLVVLS